MKKFTFAVTVLTMILLLSACQKQENSDSKQSVKSSAAPTQKEEIKPLEAGESISSDKLEITLKAASLKKSVLPERFSGTMTVYNYFPCKEEGKVFLDVIYKVKNKTEQSVTLEGALSVKALEDSKTYYKKAYINDKEDGKEVGQITSLEAGASENIHAVIAVPENARNLTIQTVLDKAKYESAFLAETGLGITELKKDEKININKKAEITLKKCEFKSELKPPKQRNGIYTYTYYKAKGDKTYLHITAKVKNLSKSKAEVSKFLGTSVMGSDYEIYPAFTVTEIKKGTDFSRDAEVGGNGSAALHILAEVPKSLKKDNNIRLRLFADGNYYICPLKISKKA